MLSCRHLQLDGWTQNLWAGSETTTNPDVAFKIDSVRLKNFCSPPDLDLLLLHLLTCATASTLAATHQPGASEQDATARPFVMLVLAETAIGFVVFKLSNDAKLDNKELWKEFETPEKANKACVPFSR